MLECGGVKPLEKSKFEKKYGLCGYIVYKKIQKANYLSSILKS